MNRWVWFALLGALLLPRVAGAQKGVEKGAPLGKAYELTLGDAVARRVADLLSLRPEFADVPVIAIYNRNTRGIELTLAGSRSEVAQAKAALEKLSKILAEDLLPAVRKGFGADVSESDFMLVYLNRKSGKEVVRRDHGKFLVP